MKTILIDGAGFDESNFCKLLHSEGHEVVVIDSLLIGYRRPPYFGQRIRFMEIGISD